MKTLNGNLIKEPDREDIKRLINKFTIQDDEFSMLSVNVKAFIEWYEKNKSEDTLGGKVSSYELGACIAIFADEVRECR